MKASWNMTPKFIMAQTADEKFIRSKALEFNNHKKISAIFQLCIPEASQIANPFPAAHGV